MSKLKTLFEGFESCPPVAFILLGNFLSLQAGAGYPARLKLAFRSLADVISSVSSVAQKSHVVLVPGPSDPGSPLVFPRYILFRDKVCTCVIVILQSCLNKEKVE